MEVFNGDHTKLGNKVSNLGTIEMTEINMDGVPARSRTRSQTQRPGGKWRRRAISRVITSVARSQQNRAEMRTMITH
jgi:hypothetical protein